MCNLNILIKISKDIPSKTPVDDVLGFLQGVTSNSYLGNPHGDGIFLSSGYLMKSTGKLNLLSCRKHVKNSDFILTHQRYATSGDPEKDLHPFHFGDLVLIHNGVVGTYEKGDRSDSYYLFKTVEKNFRRILETTEHSRQVALVSALKSVFNDISGGTYSIAIYDQVDKSMYYFKNSGKSISWYYSENYFYMTTNSQNAKLTGLLQEELTEIKDVDNLSIYRFDVQDEYGITYTRVGKITPKKLDSYWDTDKWNTPKNAVKVEEEEVEYEDDGYLVLRSKDDELQLTRHEAILRRKFNKLFYDNVTKKIKKGTCNLCQTETHFYSENYEDYYCEFCMEEAIEAMKESK